MLIRGTTTLIAHLGYPTETFKAPMIYNPYFEHAGIETATVGVRDDLRRLRFGRHGGVEEGRVVRRGRQRTGTAIEPGVERAEGDEAFGLVDVDVAVARDAEQHRPDVGIAR